jgi:hypothetical protein
MIKSSKTTTTKASAVFLATVLLAGTIALSAPSFMTLGLAQAQPYYGGGGMDNSYDDDRKSYGMDDSYGSSDYGRDNDRKSYGMDDSYGSSDYGRDNDRKSYDNSYGSQYQSYKPDYEPKYPSYGKDDKRDKSKDSSKSVDIKKIKCNNININLNGQGVNGGTGNGDNGNTTNGNDSNGNKTNGKDDNRFKKIDRDGFSFVCINNNNNEVGVGGGAGNVTDGVEEGCEECFDQLTGSVAEALANGLDNGFTIDGLTVPPNTSIEQLCVLLDEADITLTTEELFALIIQVFPDATDSEITQILLLLFCLEDLGIIDLDLSLIPPS